MRDYSGRTDFAMLLAACRRVLHGRATAVRREEEVRKRARGERRSACCGSADVTPSKRGDPAAASGGRDPLTRFATDQPHGGGEPNSRCAGHDERDVGGRDR